MAQAGSDVRHLPAAVVSPELARTVAQQGLSVPRFALHVDLDVIDAKEGRANSYAAGGGVSTKELVTTCTALARDLPVEALTLSAYDPACDVRSEERRVGKEC